MEHLTEYWRAYWHYAGGDFTTVCFDFATRGNARSQRDSRHVALSAVRLVHPLIAMPLISKCPPRTSGPEPTNARGVVLAEIRFCTHG